MAATGLEKIPQNLPGQEGETLDKAAESYKIIIKEKDDYEDIGRKERESNSEEGGVPEKEGREIVAHSKRIADREGALHPQADLTAAIQEAQAVDDYLKNNPDRRFDKALRDELKGKSHLEILNILAGKHEQLKKDSLTGLRSKLAHQNREVLPFQAVIDLNKFKPVNDTHGHDAGDKLLTQFGKAVKTAAGDESYRVGGDEFALQGNTREELEAKIQKLRDILSKEPFEVNGEKYTLEFSAGIGEDYKTADSEMYKEKKGGKLDAKESPADIARKNSPGINIDSKPNYRFPPIKKAKSDVYKVSPEVKEVPVDQINSLKRCAAV